jgi:putative spermidine/putrescine transport system permease protein
MLGRRSALGLVLPALCVTAILLAAPLAYLLSYGVYATGSGLQPRHGFTLANFDRLLRDPFYLSIFGRTFLLSILATILAGVFGYGFAHFMWRADRRYRGVLTILVLSPLLVSIVVTSFGWVVILGKNGLINQAFRALGLIDEPLRLMFNDFGILVGLVHVVMPFMVLSVLAALERIEPLLTEAAATLGASPVRVFRHIILPLAMPGIGAGTTIVFCLCISAYVTPAVLGGNGPNFVTTLIYNQFIALHNWPFGAAVATILLGVALLTILLYLRWIAGVSRAGTTAVEARRA